MIVVNLSRTYAAAVKTLAGLGKTNPAQFTLADLTPIAEITAGPWYNLSDLKIREYGDLIVGAFGTQVVSVYQLVDHARRPDGFQVLQLKPAYKWAPLIGAPQPGGPWQPGEGRGFRMVLTDEYRHRYETDKPSTGRWKSHLADVAQAHAAHLGREPITTDTVSHPAHITVEWPGIGPIGLQITTTGILEIEVPDPLRTRVVRKPEIALSDRQIAEKLGVSITTVRRWKRATPPA